MTPIIALHIAAGLLALALGFVVLSMSKGTGWHRVAGSIWLVLMAFAAFSSFGIKRLHPGHFSWIHLLSVLTLIGLARTALAIRRGDVAGHRRALIGPFAGLVIAGVLAFATPGRLLISLVLH